MLEYLHHLAQLLREFHAWCALYFIVFTVLAFAFRDLGRYLCLAKMIQNKMQLCLTFIRCIIEGILSVPLEGDTCVLKNCSLFRFQGLLAPQH